MPTYAATAARAALLAQAREVCLAAGARWFKAARARHGLTTLPDAPDAKLRALLGDAMAYPPADLAPVPAGGVAMR